MYVLAGIENAPSLLLWASLSFSGSIPVTPLCCSKVRVSRLSLRNVAGKDGSRPSLEGSALAADGGSSEERLPCGLGVERHLLVPGNDGPAISFPCTLHLFFSKTGQPRHQWGQFHERMHSKHPAAGSQHTCLTNANRLCF